MRPRNFEKKKKSTASEIRFKEILDRFKEQPNLIYFHKETVKSMVTEMACGPRYSYALVCQLASYMSISCEGFVLRLLDFSCNFLLCILLQCSCLA